ncbi:ankyrin repeat domain-containing protein [Corallococcus exiguus]|nr:ankyrin repeat domain-containing protein [Corallococcus exiguus]
MAIPSLPGRRALDRARPNIAPADTRCCPGSPTVRSPTVSLFDAVAVGDRAALSAQLDAGADSNPFDSDGRTPLMAAARVGRADLVRVLLEADVAPDDFRRKLASAGAYVAGKLGDDGATKRLERVLRSEGNAPKRRK